MGVDGQAMAVVAMDWIPVRCCVCIDGTVITARSPFSVGFGHHVKCGSKLTALRDSNYPLIEHLLKFGFGCFEFFGRKWTDSTVGQVACCNDLVLNSVPWLRYQSWLCHLGESLSRPLMVKWRDRSLLLFPRDGVLVARHSTDSFDRVSTRHLRI